MSGLRVPRVRGGGCPGVLLTPANRILSDSDVYLFGCCLRCLTSPISSVRFGVAAAHVLDPYIVNKLIHRRYQMVESDRHETTASDLCPASFLLGSRFIAWRMAPNHSPIGPYLYWIAVGLLDMMAESPLRWHLSHARVWLFCLVPRWRMNARNPA